MEWLKAKKNLPIVVALAVFFLLGAGGLIAWELGAFNGSSSSVSQVPVVPAASPAGGPGYPPGGPPTGYPPSTGVPPVPHGPRGRTAPGIPRGVVGTPGALAAAAVPKINANTVNPAIGPDPFSIPNGAKKLAAANARLLGPKPPLREAIGPLNLFRIRPPALPPAPVVPGLDVTANGAQDPAANYRLSGVITGTDGINAILEVGGQSQSVKPGDSLPDGSRVQNIQTTSITLRTAGGAVINLPLSAGTPDQGTFNQGPNGFNGSTPGQPGSYNGYGGPPPLSPG